MSQVIDFNKHRMRWQTSGMQATAGKTIECAEQRIDMIIRRAIELSKNKNG